MNNETRQPIPWVKWDFAQWLGGKVSRRPAIEQAVFINLQALMMRDGGPCQMEAADILDMADRLHAAPADIEQAIANLSARGIVVVVGDVVDIKFLSEQFATVNETRSKRIEAGAKGGKAKAKQILASATNIVASATTFLAEKEKSREEEEKEDIRVADAPPTPKEKQPPTDSLPDLQDQWNKAMASFGQLRVLSPVRKKKWEARAAFARKSMDIATQQELLDAIVFESRSLGDFAKSGGWLSFDWIVESDNNLAKYLEGRYRDKEPVKQQVIL